MRTCVKKSCKHRMQPDLEVVTDDVGVQNVSPELSEDIEQTQPVETPSPTMVVEGAM